MTMKKLLFLILVLLCSMTTATTSALAAMIYTVYDNETKTLTYYYDNNYNAGNPYHELYDPVNAPDAERFADYYDQVVKAVIDPSMKSAPLTSTYRMFYGGRNDDFSYVLGEMTSIEGLENLNTANVTNMGSMFYGCRSLKALNLSSFDMSKVTNTSSMFLDCYFLRTIVCDNDWSTSSKLTSSDEMFSNCDKLVGGEGTMYNSSFTDKTYARLDGGTAKPGYFTSTVKKLTVYTVYNTSTKTLTYYYNNDYDAGNSYHELYDPFDAPDATRFAGYAGQVVKAVIDPSMKSAPLTSMYMMFRGNQDLSAMTSIEGMENLNTANVTDMSLMFSNCSALTSIDLSSFNTANVTSIQSMFCSCSALTSIDLSTFNTAKVTDMSRMFSYCEALTTLDLSSFDVSKVTDIYDMFYGCSALTTIVCDDDWTTNSKLKAIDEFTNPSYGMFKGCIKLMGSEGTCYDYEFTDITYARPDGGTAKPGYFSILVKEPQVYTVYNASTKTLTYYYDAQMEYKTDVTELYNPVGSPNAVRFTDYYDKVKKAVIDPSMKDAPLTSMRNMFYGGYNMKTSKPQTLSALTTIEGLEYLNTDQVTTMENMFVGCQSLSSVDISAFNTENVTNMNGMFNYCSSLQTLDLNSFDVSKVTNMVSMFAGCSELTTIWCLNDWSGTTASSDHMFEGCNKLIGGKATVYNSSVVDATYARLDGGTTAPGYFSDKAMKVYTVFDDDHTLTYYYDKNFDTENPLHVLYDPVDNPIRFKGCHLRITKVVIDPSMKEAPLTSMTDMFFGGRDEVTNNAFKLEALTVIEGQENLNTAFVTNMNAMFYGCSALKSLDLSTFNTAKVTDMGYMFSECAALTSLNLSTFNTENVTEMRQMFKDCNQLASLDLSTFNTEKVGEMSYMFSGCSALKSLDLSTFNTENVGNMEYMFSECAALTFLDLSTFNTENVGNMRNMFSGCSALKSLDLSTFNTAKVKDMSTMFYECAQLQTVDLTMFDVNKVEFISGMFYGCETLTTIWCRNDWSTRLNQMISSHMFYGCENLVGGHGTVYDSQYTNAAYARPDGGTEAPGYFTRQEVYTEYDEVTQTLTYYYDDQILTRTGITEVYDPVANPDAVRFTGYYDKVVKAVIDPSMKEAALTSTCGMFYSGEMPGLSNLTTIEGLENLNTALVTDMSSMFFYCQSLTSLDLRSFNTAQVKDMSAMFMVCSKLETLNLTSFDISKVENTNMMFANCKALTTIWCNDDWSVSEKLTKSTVMFYLCNALEGGKGTAYNSSIVDKTYARTDGGTEAPGYFTKKEPCVYTVYNEDSQTLTYYYDTYYDAGNPDHELYDPINNPDAVRFNSYYSIVTKAVIDPSMKDAPLTSTRMMFYGGYNEGTKMIQGLSAMTAIEGLENLNTEKMTDMSYMFYRCEALTSLDLRSFDISQVTNMNSMFEFCNALTTIYCEDDWSTSTALAYSDFMFFQCTALVGGEGTTYNSSYKDKTYARPDGGKEAPGYFTSKPPYIKGDANGDGVVNMADAVAIGNYVAGVMPIGFNVLAADVNGDGKVTITDAVSIVVLP